jgi:hypothetical protein
MAILRPPKVLLVFQILIRCYQEIETFGFGGPNQIPVAQCVPANLAEGRARLDRKGFSSDREAAVRMLQNRFDLFLRHPGKPDHKLIHPRATLQILEKGRHRKPRAAKNPGAAHLFRRAFDHWT